MGGLPTTLGSPLVADEVHRYGAERFAPALSSSYSMRLGLTPTLERTDDGVEDVLVPYFQRTIDGCSYRRAYDDGILAPVKVALIGVDLTPREREEFDTWDEMLRRTTRSLTTAHGVDAPSSGELIAEATRIARQPAHPGSRTARGFLKAFSARREVLAGCRNKAGLVEEMATVIPHAQRSLVFTDQIATAESAAGTMAARGVAAVTLTSEKSAADREGLLAEFREGRHRALCAPRILDEGIDVPAADFAVVLAASKTRRQMIQRVGRVLRPKPDGRNAVFGIAYVVGTPEDPELGGHVAFLEEFLSIADEVQTVDVASAAHLLIGWLGGVVAVENDTPEGAATAEIDDVRVGVRADDLEAIDEQTEFEPRRLVLSVFDDHANLVTFDEVVTSV